MPIFSDRSLKVSQLDLTRGIEAAVEAGAHPINISGGQLTDGESGDVDEFPRRAVELCRGRNVLIVAAAGNDRCPCHHPPAAIPSVLAVGAMDDDGRPLEFSNWGADYGRQGLLAPGGEVKGAVPGGGTTELSGTSFAATIVTGVAALLLSLQIEEGRDPSPHEVREALPRNPGSSPKDRALNHAATNAFQATEVFARAVAERRTLEEIEVLKSPICRINSDCWDIKLKFFDPDSGRAKRACRLSVDVSDMIPVTLGEVRTWLTKD